MLMCRRRSWRPRKRVRQGGRTLETACSDRITCASDCESSADVACQAYQRQYLYFCTSKASKPAIYLVAEEDLGALERSSRDSNTLLFAAAELKAALAHLCVETCRQLLHDSVYSSKLARRPHLQKKSKKKCKNKNVVV